MSNSAPGMPLPHPTLIAPADSRKSLDERSVRPFAPASQLPLFERSGRPRWGRMFHTAPPAIAGWDVRVGCGVVLAGTAFGGTWCPRAPTSGSRSGAFAGCGSPRCRVEVPGFGDAGAAFGLDAVGPGDAEPVA